MWRIMKSKTDIKKKMQEVRFTTEFCMNEDQYQKLIRDKIERNERLYLSNKMKEKRILES